MKIAAMCTVATFVIAATAHAENTTCVLVQTCPVSLCPYLDSNNNSFKEEFMQCKMYSDSQGFKLLGFVPGPPPRCKSLATFEGKVNCADLQ
jgi:hypothetical protein